MKSIFDFIVSLLGLIILLPLFVILSLLVFFNDKGPVFFKQWRVGKDGRMFVLYKFRSMKVLEAGTEACFEPGNTSRITRVGKIIRKTKLDELPQLINVLRGEMSLVGPRPEIKKWVDAYPEKWKLILSIKPGITDNASLAFRNEESLLAESMDPEATYREIILPEKLELYEQYTLNHTFTGDLKLIMKTLITIFKNKPPNS
jgi:lipopolysaccharide/colanic/teichoic acid biosynthesis glycosyltransferase